MFLFMNNPWRIRKVRNMAGHPAGKPLSQELNPESEVVQVRAAPEFSTRETSGRPVHPEKKCRVFEKAVTRARRHWPLSACLI